MPIANTRQPDLIPINSNLRLRAYDESGTENGNSLEFDFVVPPPHS